MPVTTPMSDTPEKIKVPVQFDPELFVNRLDIISAIEAKVEALQRGESVRRRTIHISGEWGVGKTWLLLKFHRDYLKKLGALSIFVDFDVYTREKQALKEKGMEFRVESLNTRGFLEFLKTLSQALGVPVPRETSIQEQSYWVVEKLTEYARQQVVVLLLDGLFTAPSEFVDLLEDYLLAPIISLGRTLVILSGRGKAPLFSNYYLRNEAEDERLEAFTKEELIKLFIRLKETDSYTNLGEKDLRALDEIYRASGGYPRTALILARDGLEEGVENAINELLAFIEEKEKREDVRQHLDALVLLNRWDPELSKDIEWGMRDSDALAFLNAYLFFHEQIVRDDEAGRIKQELDEDALETLYDAFGKWEGKKKKSYLRAVRGELQALQLLRWETKREDIRGYFIDEAVRYPIAYALWKRKRALWQWLHYVGWRLFESWTKGDGRFKRLADEHRKAFPLSEHDGKGEAPTPQKAAAQG